LDGQAGGVAQMIKRPDAATQFIAISGWGDAARHLLAGDASNRRYDRLTRPDGTTAVFMDAPPDRGEDVRPFVKVATELSLRGLSAPRILAQDTQNGFLLIEDLGDAVFGRLMVHDPAMTAMLYTAATDALVALHSAPTFALMTCDADWLVDATGLLFDWYTADGTLADAFNALFHPLAHALDRERRVVILRDFHAQNLIWLPDRTGIARVGLLDFQDALLGHPAYDLVSVLQDARRDVAPEIEAEMMAHYIRHTKADTEAFLRAYALLGLQRNLRILGIFARLCLRDGKAQYVDLIPRVWGYVQRNLAHPDLADIAAVLAPALPQPTPEFLEGLRTRCATPPTP